MTTDSSALSLIEKLIECYHFINNDLLEECLEALSIRKNDINLQSFLIELLESQPSLMLFRLAQCIHLKPNRKIFDSAKDDPMLLMNFLSLMEIQDSTDVFTLTHSDLNYILKHENFLLLDKVKKNTHFFIEDGQKVMEMLDFSNPFSLIYLEGPMMSLTVPPTKEVFLVTRECFTPSLEGLLQAITRSISYSFQMEECHCSKLHECHDY